MKPGSQPTGAVLNLKHSPGGDRTNRRAARENRIRNPDFAFQLLASERLSVLVCEFESRNLGQHWKGPREAQSNGACDRNRKSQSNEEHPKQRTRHQPRENRKSVV